MNYMKKVCFLTAFICCINSSLFSQEGSWKDPNSPIEERVEDLISKLTLEEKESQMLYWSKEIERLNIPAYNWWNEALHGVARAGRATVFPQPIGLAATFDDELIHEISTAISDEARAKYNAAMELGNITQYMGLTFWSPNVNIFRDPRWGRGHETYGEDPFLSAKMGVAFVKGLQGNDPDYLKTAACAKHYVVHSGPEALRHEFNAIPPKKDFAETYLPAFEALVKEANVEAVMCAYNMTYDEPCCGNSYLLQDILREQWGFKGHVVSDCWALRDFYNGHNVVKTQPEAAAMALKAGVNLNCGYNYNFLTEAVEIGHITEEEIDRELGYLLRTRFKLGLFDPPEKNPFNAISEDVIHSDKHVKLAYEAALKSVVMLKNKNNVLPLDKRTKHMVLMGVHGNDAEVLYGNYKGQSPEVVTIAEGITRKIHAGTRFEFWQGHELDREKINPIDWVTPQIIEADVVVVAMGISNKLEGEEGESMLSPYKGDRMDINLPEVQIEFIKTLRSHDTITPIVLILTGGSPISIEPVEDLVDAVLYVWYPGEQGGSAIADILFGDVSPSGRLPLTFPKSIDQLPPYEDYSMEGRTYRYMEKEPLYPFGFGLSYSQFEYGAISLSKTRIKKNETNTASVTITNTGNMAAEEVIQMYITDVKTTTRAPLFSLKGFKRVDLKPGEEKTVSFKINPDMLTIFDDEGNAMIEPGMFKVYIGGSLPSERSLSLGAPKWAEAEFNMR